MGNPPGASEKRPHGVPPLASPSGAELQECLLPKALKEIGPIEDHE